MEKKIEKVPKPGFFSLKGRPLPPPPLMVRPLREDFFLLLLLHSGSEWMNYQMDRRRKLHGAMRSSISKHGYSNRKGIQDLELLPSLPFSITFKSFGGRVKGHMLLKVKAHADRLTLNII